MAPIGLQLFAAIFGPKGVDTGPPGTGGPPLFAAGLQKEVDAIEQKPQATQLDLLETKNPASHSLAAGDAKVTFSKPQVFDLLSLLGIKVPVEVSDFDPERFVESLTNEARAFLASYVSPKATPTADIVELSGREWNPAGSKPVFYVANPASNRPSLQPTCDRPAPAPVTKDPLVDLTALIGARPSDQARPERSELIDVDVPDVLQFGGQKPLVFDSDISTSEKPIVFDLPEPQYQILSKRGLYTPIPLTTAVVDPTMQRTVSVKDAPVSISATSAVPVVPQSIEKEIIAALNVAKVVTEQMPKLPAQNSALTERVAASTQITAKPRVNTVETAEEPVADDAAVSKSEVTGAKPKIEEDDDALAVTQKDTPDVDTLNKPNPLTVAKPQKIEHASARPEPIKPEVHAEIRQRIVEQVQELAALHSRQSVTIKLQPEDLGTLTILVNGTQENVEAKVTASNDAVRHSLAAHRTELVQSIESRGMNLGSFTVGQEQQTDTQHGGKANHHNDMRQDFSRAANLAAPRHESAPVYARTTTKGVDTLA